MLTADNVDTVHFLGTLARASVVLDEDTAPVALRSKAPPAPVPQSAFSLVLGEVTGFARMLPRERGKGAYKRTNGCSAAYRSHESRASFSRG